MHRTFILTVAAIAGSTLILEHAVSQPAPDLAFESLPPCEKLRGIENAGKSVVNYIAESGYAEFDDAVRSECTEFRAQLDEALRQVGLDPTFEALSACEKLGVIEATGQSLVDYIRGSGPDDFATEVGNNCRQYLPVLNQAGFSPEGGPGSDAPFAVLPRCEQLDIIDSDPNKSVSDHIFGSGIEDYADAVRNECNRHLEALEEAERRAGILLPDDSANTDGLDPDFEALAPCQKLDVIDGSGKSVPQYIADSGLGDFSADVYSMCRRHIEALTEAQRIVEASN